MSQLRTFLAAHRAGTFCVVTFALTWAFWFAAVYPAAIPLLRAGQNPLSGPAVTLFVGAGMFFPAIGVVLTRLLTGEGFRGAWVRPREFRRTWKYWVAGWFGPMLLVALGAVVFFLIFPSDFDPSCPLFLEATNAQLAAAGQPPMDEAQAQALMGMQLALVLVCPLLNAATCFGEEWGWRGYLLPHLMERHSATWAIVAVGVIWGLWHAPITVLGHNYGLDYPGWPVVGILAMICFCTALSALFGWLTLRSGSCLPATFAHGALNGCVSAPALFMAVAPNPFVGPLCTGIIGGIGLIVAAILCVVSLRRNPSRFLANGGRQ